MTFTDDERAHFDELVTRDLRPYTIVAREGRFTLAEIAQDLFPDERILRVRFATRPLFLEEGARLREVIVPRFVERM